MSNILFQIANTNSPGPSEREGPRPVSHYDADGRLSSLEWAAEGDAASRHIVYVYDGAGRLATASNELLSVSYAYHDYGHECGYTLTLPSGARFVRNVSRFIRHPNTITGVSNFFVTVTGETNALPSFTYVLDDLLRPTGRNADSFAYDARSQVTAATLRSAETNIFAYAYDNAGNRMAAAEAGVATSYTANELNQYSAISGDLPAYDADGNLLANGVWSYAWDAENRLAAAYSNDVCVVSNAYDAFSRRVLKVTPTETHTFFYDDWNVVREVVRDKATGSIAELRDYYWGRDLSDSLQGAGGVGGLLAYTRNGALRIPVYDHIGNIVAVVDSTGATIAAYEYDPFGNIIAQSASEADEVPFRFSTKYFDAETGLYYYGYRFYAPELGRWINRDPVEESNNCNLYCFNKNAPSKLYDLLGMFDFNPESSFDQLHQSYLKYLLCESLIDDYYLAIANIVSHAGGYPWFYSFLYLYFFGDGTEPMVLSAGHVSELQTDPELFSVKTELSSTPDRSVPVTTSTQVFGVNSTSRGNSTLGQFNVQYRGQVCSGRFVGEYRIVDRFNFDWKPWRTGGRTIVGELEVRAFSLTANGMPFDVISEWIPLVEDLQP